MHTSNKIKAIVSVQEAGWLKLGKTFRDRIWTLHKRTLTMSTDKRATFHTVAVTQGKPWHGKSLGIQIQTEDGTWLRATTNSKAQWAMWLQAFHELKPVPAKSTSSPKAVQFNDLVRVRTIPANAPVDDAWEEYDSATDDDEASIVSAA
ncbi:Aste57867_8138 [Aphanomyces stellatus]|uniref:Aste57867_8138 protein n=1 Tax=Aphanomyces stellatus TaxID=120398 RepID=A0A485KJF7_9STRA|nr:hypothetical protein As57867_008108 [Aphanomyces stellatus]VFT85027.1 Aste57867_8138 [Aphanomyces stellatus]